jgi:lipoprotein-anchoring transpeptidase ErfK/SrfK
MVQSLAQASKHSVSAVAILCVATLATTLVDIQPAQAQFSFYDYGFQNPFRERRAYRNHQPAPAYQTRRQPRRETERRQAVAKPVAKPQTRQTVKPVEQQVAVARVEHAPEPRIDNPVVQSTSIGRPLYAVISISAQKLAVYGSDGLMLESKVSTGTADNPTPTGAFAIIQKNRWHESNLYSDSPMPFMQRITWSGVAMHHGKLPGYPASHGCIRLPWDFAEKWFGMTKLGLRIIIAPNEAAPTPITHVNLPQPRYWPAPGEFVDRPAFGFGKTAQLRTGRTDQILAEPTERSKPVKLLDPQAYAAAERIRIKAALKQSQQAEGETEVAAKQAAETAETTKDNARKASRRLSATHTPMTHLVTTGQSPLAAPDADFETDLAAAVSDYITALRQLVDLRATEAATRTAAFQAASLATRTDQQTEALQVRLAEMTRRQETVSIFISRKDQRLYVRQALRPVADMSVTIEDLDRPLGTHVFMAVPKRGDDIGLNWQAVSLPPEAETAKPPASRRGSEIETASIAPTALNTLAKPDPARAALDRIKLPGEVLDELSELLGPGSSLIVSDRGITHETGVGTDFIVQTKH